MKLILTTLSFISVTLAAGAATFYTNGFDKDSFVRALAPNSNYGGGGALSVSGTNATVSNPTNGAFDSFMNFNTKAMVSNFNAAFGTNNWVVTSATLNLTENPDPGNAVFNYGTGYFAVHWIASNNWVEGTGNPNAPATTGLTYSQEPTYLNSNTDMNLGAFDFTNSSGGPYPVVSCPLALPVPFVTNMQAGGEVGLFLTAVDPSIGFVFYSHDFKGNTSVLPTVVVSATRQPVVSAISVSGSNLVLSATNGVTGGMYSVLTSTNIGLPLNQWIPVLTNGLAAGSNFTVIITNAADPNSLAPQFFVLQTY